MLWELTLLQKDNDLIVPLLASLLDVYWPRSATSNSSKEVLLLHELQQILECAPPPPPSRLGAHGIRSTQCS